MMKKESKKKEKPTPKRCVCGSVPIISKTRLGKMVTCPNPEKCIGNLRTRWQKHEDTAIAEWNALVDSVTHQR